MKSSLQFIPTRSAARFRALFPNRPLETILFGGLTFAERWELMLKGPRAAGQFMLHASPLTIPSQGLIDEIRRTPGEKAWESCGNAVVALLGPERAEVARRTGSLETACKGLVPDPADDTACIDFPWQLLEANERRIEEDIALLESIDGDWGIPSVTRPSTPDVGRFPGVKLIGDTGIHLGPEAELEPFVFLDTREGPIWIGARVFVEANTILRGPIWLRDDVRVRGGAKLGEGTTVGEGSRIGGEIEATLFGAFSNKQHDGFLGHALVGEWVNLGAGTNNSDLKNNYGTVRVDLGEGPQETGLRKIGCFLGDHVKSAIGTRISTGTAVGPCANLFGPTGLVSGWVPPFTWGESGSLYDWERAADTIQVVRSRRARLLDRSGRPAELPAAERDALEAVFQDEVRKRATG